MDDHGDDSRDLKTAVKSENEKILPCDAEANDHLPGDTDERRDLPVDRGWAWAVLAGVSLYLFLFGAVRKNLGLFFVAFQENYNTNASVTSLVMTIQNVTFSVASLLVMTLGMHLMTNRTSILIGGIFKTAAIITAALSKDVAVLFFSIGILEGIGISFSHNPIISMLGEYFIKKRGMANGLAFCFASFGALVFAPVLTTLFDLHGYTGTMLVAAGMSFNCCVTGMLLRPLTSFKKISKPQTKSFSGSDSDQKETLLLKEIPAKFKNGDINPPFRSMDQIAPNPQVKRMIDDSELYKMHSCDKVNILRSQCNRRRTCSENNPGGNLNQFLESFSHSDIALYASTGGLGGSVLNLHDTVEQALSQTDETEVQIRRSCCMTCKTSIRKVFSIIFDVSLFRKSVFPCILLMGFMFVGAGDCVLIMLPPYAKDIGLTNDQRGILMLMFGCFDLFSRIVLTVIADRTFIKKTNILVFTSFLLGVACHSLRFFNSFGAMVVFSIITGCCTHLYWALHAVILVEYLTVAKLKSSLGFITLCNGLALSIVLPIAGIIRDSTGTYVATYHMLGTILLIGAVAAFSIPHVDAYLNKKPSL